MPRTKAVMPPKLQHHRATGQARVTIAGRDYYCGRWGSKEATAKYHRLLAEFFNGNGAAPIREGTPADDAVQAVIVSPRGVQVTMTGQSFKRRIDELPVIDIHSF